MASRNLQQIAPALFHTSQMKNAPVIDVSTPMRISPSKNHPRCTSAATAVRFRSIAVTWRGPIVSTNGGQIRRDQRQILSPGQRTAPPNPSPLENRDERSWPRSTRWCEPHSPASSPQAIRRREQQQPAQEEQRPRMERWRKLRSPRSHAGRRFPGRIGVGARLSPATPSPPRSTCETGQHKFHMFAEGPARRVTPPPIEAPSWPRSAREYERDPPSGADASPARKLRHSAPHTRRRHGFEPAPAARRRTAPGLRRSCGQNRPG